MGYRSSYSTPKNPSSPDLIDTSTPWSEVLLEEYAARQLEEHQSLLGQLKDVVRTHARSWNRIIWLAVFIVAGISWMLLRRTEHTVNLQVNTESLDYQVNTDGLQFIDANHPHIRYVGRWLSTAEEIHKDGSFPGVYFDFAMNGSATVLLSLHNRELQTATPAQSSAKSSTLAFLPLANTTNAAPISLLARVDDDEYIVLPNAASIVTIRRGDLNKSDQHNIRIIAPMVGENTAETLQIEGLWIDKGGQLLPTDGTFDNNNDLSSDDQAGFDPQPRDPSQKKMLEIVTDLPGSMACRNRHKDAGTAHAILGGVMGWEYLLGEMFGADHVTIGTNGMCLIRDCIGGRSSPVGLSDVFFQSGPAGSEGFDQAWLFQEYIPDVMVMNLGNSDWDSFQSHQQEYNLSMWDLEVVFEETYVSMIRAIRTLAYPKATPVDVSRYTYGARNAAAGIPIFIMRPFRGQLEQATHSIVDRLQKEGDKAIFWLDTSGWLNTEVDFEGRAEDQDFFLDGNSQSKQWRLTERGNQRVAILLHMHVCRYLAQDVEKCVFLPPEIYQGKALDHEAIHFDEFLEDEKERKLKKMFWK